MAGELFGKRLRRTIARHAPLRLLVSAAEGAVLLSFLGVAAALPPAAASRAGAALLGWIGPRLPKSRHVRRNLSFALPEADAARLATVERGCWRTLGAVLAEMPHLRRLADLDRRSPAVDLRIAPGAEALQEQLQAGGRFVFATAHLGNWELLPPLLVRLGREIAVIYTPQGNSLTDGLLQWLRGRGGVRFIGKQGGVRELLRALNDGSCLGLLVDLRSDEGEAVPFFGVPAMTSTVPARLALRAGAQLVPVRCERLGPARFRVTVEPPLTPRDAAATATLQAWDMTEQLNARFAEWIRAAPEDWLCTKRRFPKEASPSPGALASGESRFG